MDTRTRLIEVLLSRPHLEVTCRIVLPDGTATAVGVDALSLRGAQREMTAWLAEQGYEPASDWSTQSETDRRAARTFRRQHPGPAPERGGFSPAPDPGPAPPDPPPGTPRRSPPPPPGLTRAAGLPGSRQHVPAARRRQAGPAAGARVPRRPPRRTCAPGRLPMPSATA